MEQTETEPINNLGDLGYRLCSYIESTYPIFLDHDGEVLKDDEFAKEMVDEAHILLNYLDPENW